MRAHAPSIAGFYGAFTGQKSDGFSVSFNVRMRGDSGPTHDQLLSNLERNLDASRTPQGTAILHALLSIESFAEGVQYLKDVKMTSPGHFTVGGLKGEEGVVITRTEDEVSHLFELDDTHWFVAMTNADVWDRVDPRYESAVKYMDVLGRANVQVDGYSIIEEVLW